MKNLLRVAVDSLFPPASKSAVVLPSGQVFSARVKYDVPIGEWDHWETGLSGIRPDHFPLRGTGEADVQFELLEPRPGGGWTLMEIRYLAPRRGDIRAPDIAESLAALLVRPIDPHCEIICPCGRIDENPWEFVGLDGKMFVACLVANGSAIKCRWISVSQALGDSKILAVRKAVTTAFVP